MKAMKLLEQVRRFQEHLLELGVARAILALPAPRMLALPSPASEGAEWVNLYSGLITEVEIVTATRDLYASGFYTQAVHEAYKVVDKYIAVKAKKGGISGTSLMEYVFSPKDPKLYWTDRKTRSESDEQEGYFRIYVGTMQGIRNPVAHELGWVEEPEAALDLIAIAQHLLRKAKSALVAGRQA
jgi:uncharacterized protein (TIGR02391 family)